MGEKKSVHVYLNPDEHKALKRIALENDTSVTALVDRKVKEIIADRGSGKGNADGKK